MERVNNILNDPEFKDNLKLNYKREQNRRFCRHDIQHFIDTARICYILVLEELSRGRIFQNIAAESLKEAAYTSGLLHDIGRWRQYDTGEDHALVSAEISFDILKRSGFENKEIAIITSAISNHRTSSRGGGLLGECLRRADDLSRPCWSCNVQSECKKYSRMESARGLIY
ncbi:MAG: HD domain-containing protein [Clostridiales bacterium]|nr:HD domain-containing protein [Clostridiales bacterium]MCF8023748.1 HD domain-containing protein [Clostridiales bacterium]